MESLPVGRWVLDAALPARCLHCGRPAAAGHWRPFLCLLCAADLVYCGAATTIVGGFGVRAVFAHTGPARMLVHALKYRAETALGPPLGRQLAALVRGLEPHVVVPVPLHWWRAYRRGHNQAETLARCLVRNLPGWPLAPMLRRRRATLGQVGLGEQARRQNVSGAFELRRGSHVAGRAVVLVDDVVTTGATAGEAAAVLRRGGATSVMILAVARAERMANQVSFAAVRRAIIS